MPSPRSLAVGTNDVRYCDRLPNPNPDSNPDSNPNSNPTPTPTPTPTPNQVRVHFYQLQSRLLTPVFASQSRAVAALRDVAMPLACRWGPTLRCRSTCSSRRRGLGCAAAGSGGVVVVVVVVVGGGA